MIFEALLSKNTLWLVFLVSGFLTVFFAAKTVKYFTLYSKHIKISISALGGLLLALITSLPELINGIISGVLGNATLVYSNVIGANSILLVFYSIFSIYFVSKTMKSLPSKNLIIVISSVVVSMLLFGIMFFVKDTFIINIGNHQISFIVLLQLFLYIAFFLYLMKGGNSDDDSILLKGLKTKIKSKFNVFLVFSMFSLALIISAILLNNVVTRMGDSAINGGYGIGNTLAGAIFLSIVTTLPEIVSMYKLMKFGLFNTAGASGIGSHMFNFTILFLTDAIYNKAVLGEVYANNYTQQSYIWGIYFLSYIVFVNGLFNKYIRRRMKFLVWNFLQIPIIFITGWLLFGLKG